MTIADLIGEVDMIKHAEGRYLSSELTMHFGLIPRTNRGIFCINELPDLAPKIQVGLFNVLEERDIQIRGYPVRLDLDLCMVFSANPEDYTNRGRIVTPLKDRIGSVVRTHYPLTREIGIAISDQNAWLERQHDGTTLAVPQYVKEIVEEISRLARTSPHVNQQSGVSVRMSIANLENVVSNAERRSIINHERWIVPRVSDLASAAASSRGKLELTMSEDDGHEDKLIQRIIDEATKNIFGLHLDVRELRPIVDYFESGHNVEVGDASLDPDHARANGQGARAAEAGRGARRAGDARRLRSRRPRGRCRQRGRVHPRGAARPQQAQQGGQGRRGDLPALISTREDRSPMSLFEYSKWDGSQQFLPQSADKVFDQLSEYLMQYGERVLRNMDDLEEEMPEVVELIQKEGLIEKDREGQWRVTPKGIRRIQDKSLDDLFQTFRRDSLGRHDTAEKGAGHRPARGHAALRLRRLSGPPDLHETIKNAYIRQGGGVPIKLSSEDYVVHETEYQTRCATVVLIDMSGSMGRYGKYYTTKKVALALQAMVRSRYPQDSLQMIGFYTFANVMNERQLINSAPKPVSMFDSRIHLRFDLDHPVGRVPQHFTNIHAGLRLARSVLIAAARGEQADHRDHRRRADRPHRGPRGRADLPAGREDRHAHAGRGPPLRQRRHPRVELRADRGLFLPRPGQLRRGDGPRLEGRGRVLLDRRDRQPRLRELRRRPAYEAVRSVRRMALRQSGLSSNSFSLAESGSGRRGSQDSSTSPTSIMSRM